MLTVRLPVPLILKMVSRLTKEERLPDAPMRFADACRKVEFRRHDVVVKVTTTGPRNDTGILS